MPENTTVYLDTSKQEQNITNNTWVYPSKNHMLTESPVKEKKTLRDVYSKTVNPDYGTALPFCQNQIDRTTQREDLNNP